MTLSPFRLLLACSALAGGIVYTVATSGEPDSAVEALAQDQLPPGYRDWKLISVAHEEGDLNDIRAILGNDVAIRAYREGILRFPDGAAIARLAWKYEPSDENNKAFGRAQSFVAGAPVNGVQFMVKDSKRYAATGGWGFAQFDGDKPIDKAKLHACFTCHQFVPNRDLVFTRYSP